MHGGGGEGPERLQRALNKRFTLEGFAAAARALDDRGVALRVFLLISPPFIDPGDQDAWLLRSVDAAFNCGAAVVSLVPMRPGNGTIDADSVVGKVWVIVWPPDRWTHVTRPSTFEQDALDAGSSD